MAREHWIEDVDGMVHMTRSGYPHQVHVSVLDAIRDGRQVASCIQELWAAHDYPIPPGYTGIGKTGTGRRAVKPRKPAKRQGAGRAQQTQETALF